MCLFRNFVHSFVLSECFPGWSKTIGDALSRFHIVTCCLPGPRADIFPTPCLSMKQLTVPPLKTWAVCEATFRSGIPILWGMWATMWWPVVLTDISCSEEHLSMFVTHCQQHLRMRNTAIKSYLCAIKFTYLRHNVFNSWLVGLRFVQKLSWKQLGGNTAC